MVVGSRAGRGNAAHDQKKTELSHERPFHSASRLFFSSSRIGGVFAGVALSLRI
jgi:hypothetical protein